jgi:hypothetical protein
MHTRRIVVCDGNVEIGYIGKICKVPVYVHFLSEGQLTEHPAVVFVDVMA